MNTVWFLIIFGLGWDSSPGHIPQTSMARCQQQAQWINDSQRGHAYCVEGTR